MGSRYFCATPKLLVYIRVATWRNSFGIIVLSNDRHVAGASHTIELWPSFGPACSLSIELVGSLVLCALQLAAFTTKTRCVG